MSKRTTSARELLHRRVYAGRPGRLADLEQTRREMALGVKIHRLRKWAGISQVELARRVGTKASSISRMEASDYDGHSLRVLRKVAAALGMTLVVDFERAREMPNGRSGQKERSR